MATRRKIMVSGDHLEPFDKGPPWTVLWDTRTRPEGEWSTAGAQSEATALDRAAHFLKLGFAVHAIRDPSGAVVMDATAIVDRLTPAAITEPRSPSPEPSSVEQSTRQMLRGFLEGYGARPGRMLAATSVRALVGDQGMRPAEFERAITYAMRHDWLIIADGTLTLTQLGYDVAVTSPYPITRPSGRLETHEAQTKL